MPHKTPETKPLKLRKLQKDAAVLSVLVAVREFLEDNPDFEGSVNQHVIEFDAEKLKGADNDYIQRLTLIAMQVETLSHEAVQKLARSKTLKFYPKVKELTFEIHDNHVNVHLTISKLSY